MFADLTIQGLLQCRNEELAQWKAALASQQVGFTPVPCDLLAIACCRYVRAVGWHSSWEELGLHGRNCLVLVSAYSYTLLRGSFFWRYIYVADIFDHNIHVMEKHANWSLTHVKVSCCCFIEKRHIWILDRLVSRNAWDFGLIVCEVLFWMAPAVGLQRCCVPCYRAPGLPPSHH